MMFKSVLIANRGEIAVRVIAACREMGIRSIAVYSEADRAALHAQLADEAWLLGPAPARESYLNIDAILRVAREHSAEAIHPGYGFLSENADFAEACAQAGIVFIGPPPEAIRLMGSKTAAKHVVEQAGVPTVPGYMGDTRDARKLEREAARIGYPVMLKAAAGGGGKGMRVVQSSAEFAESLAAAQREALAAFGDDSVFLEKLVIAPRHVEFQILADTHGNVIHLGERDCSIQRRHQKVIEESPSVALTPELRAKMGDAAVRAARAAGYVNAGTCEFLLDANGAFYFLEMNTRLQVEHPVTESVTGLDLVRHQFLIATGEPLGLEQATITPRGHAIEVRIYAEDPANGYLPSTGEALVFEPPRAPGVRVDTGITAGSEISVHYDPMLAKLIVTAENRPAAIERLQSALEAFAVLGVATNIRLLRAIAADTDFQAGNATTAFLETHDMSAATHAVTAAPAVFVAAALWETLAAPKTIVGSKPFNPWLRGGMNGVIGGARRFRYRDGETDHIVTATPTADGAGYAVTVDDMPYAEGALVGATLDSHTHRLTLRIGGSQENYYLARRGYDVLVSAHGASYTLALPRPLTVEGAAHHADAATGRQTLVAPMAGTIIKVNVAEGDIVSPQQTLVVLGAMKMEHAIVAPYTGYVRSVRYAAGDVVPGGEALVELEATDE
jgi:3-methylcrotonyl-CoA carboxylase alpha subunit